ncbi:MAG: phosphatase PAP2 family protein [Treponema sp.]|nr:phosphatase PAP2 family protein [Treponema sp.]
MSETAIQMWPAADLPEMPEIFRWGLDVVRLIQTIESPALTALMKFITGLGTELFYAPLALFIFWWIDEKKGLRLSILVILSAWINAFAKGLFKQPRPFHFDPALALVYEPSYGAPSGHAQISLCFFIPLAVWLAALFEKSDRRRVFIWAGTIFFILLMGFTRLYLGVHFPTDLLFGWLLGGIILLIYFTAGPRLEKLSVADSVRTRNICAAAIAFAMTSLYPADRSLPAIFLGFCIGYVLMKKHFPFSARQEINGKRPGISVMLGRCLAGFAGVALIFFGLRLVFPGEGSLLSGLAVWGQYSPYYELGDFIRYGLLGLWVSAGAPWLFGRMGLAARQA